MSSTPDDILILTLSPDNPVNTTITDDSGTILYTAEMLYPRGSKSSFALTHVYGSGGETLAALEWRDVRSDRVAFGNDVELDEEGDAVALKKGRDFPLSMWMRSSMMPFNSSVSFEDKKKRGYKWRGCADTHIPSPSQLYANDSPSTPIAQFQKSRPRASPPTPARLLLTPRAQEIADTVILSFLFLEKRRRAKDNSTQNRADVLGTPPIGFTGRLRTRIARRGGV